MEQRNRGLKWIRENHGLSDTRNGVVYFGDDDNGYDVKLFEEVSPSSLSMHASLCFSLSLCVFRVCFLSLFLYFLLPIFIIFSLSLDALY